MENKDYYLPEKLYWTVKAIIKSIVNEQENNPDVTWETSPMAVLQEMNELEKEYAKLSPLSEEAVK